MITSWIHTHVPDDFMFILYSVIIIIIIIIIIIYLFICLKLTILQKFYMHRNFT